MPDFADAMNALAGVAIAARRWRKGGGHNLILEALDRLDAIDAARGTSVVSASVGGTEDGPVREEGREGGPEAPNPARSSVSADEPCGDTVTCRDDEHEQLTCVLPKGHRSSHTTDEGAWWTDKDHWDGMDAPEVDDASPDIVESVRVHGDKAFVVMSSGRSFIAPVVFQSVDEWVVDNESKP